MRQLKITTSLTERTGITEKYFNEISREEMISPQEETELSIRIKQGDEKALNRLVKANLRFVVSVAKQYQGSAPGLTIDDLINEGNIGLIEAAKRFDHTRGFKFISYAVWWIRQSIFLAIAEKTTIVRVPLNKNGLRMKLNRLIVKLEQEYNREPTIEEIKENLDFSISDTELYYLMTNSNKSFSLDKKVSDEDNTTFMDLITDDTKFDSPDRKIMIEHQRKELNDVINSTLKPLEKYIIMDYFGMNGNIEKTMFEIGTKTDLSKERIRQIKIKALQKLKSKMKRIDFYSV